jgi:hypothetical protein
VQRCFMAVTNIQFDLKDRALQQLYLPIRGGGVGLRRYASIHKIAYLSGYAQACRHMRLVTSTPQQSAVTAVLSELRNLDIKVPKDVATMHKTYKEGVSGRHQHQLTKQMERLQLERWQRSATPFDKTRQRSAAGRSASLWLTQHPSEYAFSISDSDFIFALRHRLGMQPLPTSRWPADCSLCKERGIRFDHCHSCPILRGSVVSHRHNMLVRAVAGLCREVGNFAWEEPRLQAPDHGERPDIIVAGKHDRVMIDCSVINPSSPSYGGGARGLAARREGQKLLKYKQLAEEAGCTFVPFVLESYGTIGAQARKFLKALALEATEDVEDEDVQRVTRQFMERAMRVISFALQRGNGIVSAFGAVRLQAKGRQFR